MKDDEGGPARHSSDSPSLRMKSCPHLGKVTVECMQFATKAQIEIRVLPHHTHLFLQLPLQIELIGCCEDLFKTCIESLPEPSVTGYAEPSVVQTCSTRLLDQLERRKRKRFTRACGSPDQV
jgi:hypothetical protein